MFVSSFHSLLFCQRKYVIKPVVICQVRKSDFPFVRHCLVQARPANCPWLVRLDALIIQVSFVEVETVENGKIQAKYSLEIDLTL